MGIGYHWLFLSMAWGLEALQTYLSNRAVEGHIDTLVREQKILFCCYSRLLATMWVRSERGRGSGAGPVADHLSGSCTTFKEGLDLFISRQPTLVITTQVPEEGSSLDLINAIKEVSPGLPTLGM